MGVVADLDVVDEDGLHLLEHHRPGDEGEIQDVLAESLNEDVEKELIGHLVEQKLFEAIALAEVERDLPPLAVCDRPVVDEPTDHPDPIVRAMRSEQLPFRHIDAISAVAAAAQAAGHSFAQALGEGLDCILSCHADQ